MIEIFVKYFEKDLQNQNKSIKFAPRKTTKTYITMKRYSVKTQSSVNEMLLHSTMQREFTTDNLDEARSVFEKEVQVLSKTYAKADEFEYSPSDYETSHAIYCEITELVCDEDGEVEDILSIECSDNFYER